MLQHIIFFCSGAQGEERCRCADGTVGLPTGAPARHPSHAHRIAAAPAPTAPAPPLRVRAECVLARLPRFRAFSCPPRSICAPRGRFTSLRPRVRRHLKRPLAPGLGSKSARPGRSLAESSSSLTGRMVWRCRGRVQRSFWDSLPREWGAWAPGASGPNGHVCPPLSVFSAG